MTDFRLPSSASPAWPRRRFLRAGAASMLAPSLPLAALAADGKPAAAWPSRPVTVLVGFPGGSSPDLTARLLAERLREATGASFVVENRPGAAGNIAAAALARATDHHTISVMINGNMTIARMLNPQLTFDPLTAFAPIALVGTAPYVLATPVALAQGLDAAGWLAKARAEGSRWNYGSPGVGTVAHLGMELIKSRLGLAPVHVPYQGNPQALQALLAGEIQLSLLPPALALAQQKAGKLALIGITSAKANPLTGDLPTLQSLGAQGLDLEVWNAIAAPAGMPEAVQAQLRKTTAEVLADAPVRQKLLEQGWVVGGAEGDTSADALRRRIAADTEALGAIIREQNIRIGG
ncbi:MAG: tripartite tricarboxylate transporter substrate binding protein [Comamonadaceae bacterium]|nr:tripartite tricarboxylate transporter substrate binding protein [Comamonadaceae bacterium]